MDESRSHSKKLARLVRGGKSAAAARPARQPTRTLIAGLLWIVFMLAVWFQTPGVRLPTFFQRLVGIAAALLTMLVVMFAIREYGKRFNRLPLPLVGRVRTSRVAGGLVFLAVLGWWISPWAPIPAGEPEPDLWGLLEEGLNRPLLQVVDTNLAILVPPVPSAEAQRAAKTFATQADPLRGALVAIAASKFDEADALLSCASGGSGADRLQQCRAQLDLYRARYAAASQRYREMLQVQPRREDFLSHGALAAALAGDYTTSTAWARQLLEQARARGRNSPRAIEAANLLAGVQLLAGNYSAALGISQSMFSGGDNGRLPLDGADSTEPQDAAAANNRAVIGLLVGRERLAKPSPSSGFANAKKLWLDRNAALGRPRDVSESCIALAEYNLADAALYQARYQQAATLLNESLAVWSTMKSPKQIGMAINLNALARLDMAAGRYSRAESRTHAAADRFAAASGDDPSVSAFKATIGELDTCLARYDQAISSLQELVHDAELGHRGLSPNHPYVAILKLRLAEALLRAGRHTDAEASAAEAQRILDHAGLGESPPAAEALRIAGVAALRQGNREQAERQFDRAMKLLCPADESQPGEINSVEDKSPRPASLEMAALLAAQGELAGELQNYTAAADDYHQALEQLDLLFESQAADHPLRAEYLHALAMLLVREAKFGEAKPLLEESLAIAGRALPPTHPLRIAVMEDLASVLEQTGSKARAEELRVEARKSLGHAAPNN